MTKLLTWTIAALALLAAPAFAQDEPTWPKLDLGVYVGAVAPTDGTPEVDNYGVTLGLHAIVRVNDLLGFGFVLEQHRFGWEPMPPWGSGIVFDGDTGIEHELALLAVRLYFLQLGSADLFAQLALGYGNVTYTPRDRDCSIEDDLGAQLALGAEWRIARMLAIHSSLALTPTGWGIGCDEITTPAVPNPPYLGFGLGARLGITTTWR